MANAIRRTIGIVIAIITGYALAWWWPSIADALEGIGGMGTLILIGLLLTFVAVVVAWPDGRAVMARRVVTVVVILALFVGLLTDAGVGLRDAFTSTDWVALLIFLGVTLGTAAYLFGLWLLVVPDHPLQVLRWRRRNR